MCAAVQRWTAAFVFWGMFNVQNIIGRNEGCQWRILIHAVETGFFPSPSSGMCSTYKSFLAEMRVPMKNVHPRCRDGILPVSLQRTFGRICNICNSPGLSISIFNTLSRIKVGFDFRFARRFSIPFGRRPLVPDIHCVGIAKLRLRECSANSFEYCRARAVYLNPDEHYFVYWFAEAPPMLIMPSMIYLFLSVGLRHIPVKEKKDRKGLVYVFPLSYFCG